MMLVRVALVLSLVVGPFAMADITPVAFKQKSALQIEKSDLGKEFLLQMSMTPQNEAATSHGSASRIVYFEIKDGRLFLMESTEGHTVSQAMPSKLILAEMPFLGRGANGEIIIDFDQGMRRVFLSENWFVSDFYGKDYQEGQQNTAVDASESFINSQAKHKDGTTEIHQYVQLKMGYSRPTYEVRYYVRPYEATPGFVSRENEGFNQVGYFEANPRLEKSTGRSTVNITRWNIDKPVTYYVSANTPPEYVEAVKEGILYWNKAFGREVMRAEVAPEGVTAPHSQYNLVQWVDFDSAGVAYADALNDPKTGEIKNAQVYMTSVFAFGNKARLHNLLRILRANGTESEAEHAGHAHAHKQHAEQPGKFQHLCRYEMNQKLISALEVLADTNVPDEALLKASQDYIRLVVAHEVGHTLGLRHNFVGKMGANITQQQRDDVLAKYLREGVDPDNSILLTTSVMDYNEFADDILGGRLLMTRETAFPYDEVAIQWGYSADGSVKLDRKNGPLFCTDSDVGFYTDCTRFRYGPKPIVDYAYKIQKELKTMAVSFVDKYITAKTMVDPRDRKSVEEVWISPVMTARKLIAMLEEQMAWLNADTRSAYIEKRYPFVNSLNQKQVDEETLDWVLGQIEEAGGIGPSFFTLIGAPIQAFKWQESLDAYLAELSENQFVGANGEKASFTKEEIEFIRSQGEIYFNQLNDKLMAMALDVYANSVIDREKDVEGVLAPDSVTLQIEAVLGKLAETALTITSENEIVGTIQNGPGRQSKVLVPEMAYPLEVRIKAARLLDQKIGGDDSPAWALETRRRATQAIKELIAANLGKSIFEINPIDLDRPIREWFLEQMEILGIFLKQGHCNDLLKPPKAGVVAKKPKADGEKS